MQRASPVAGVLGPADAIVRLLPDELPARALIGALHFTRWVVRELPRSTWPTPYLAALMLKVFLMGAGPHTDEGQPT
jgi:hypothetical protein